MKNQKMTKYILTLFLGLAALASANAQAPYVNTISPTSAGVGQMINITGSNLDGVTQVVFGGTSVTIPANVSENLITVSVPFGATFSQIAVVHPTQGQGYSPQKFTPTFDGQSITDGSTILSNIGDQTAITTGVNQSQDLCLCDFDQDNDLDVSISNVGGGEISIFTNNSTIGATSFTNTSITNSFPVTNVICLSLIHI